MPTKLLAWLLAGVTCAVATAIPFGRRQGFASPLPDEANSVALAAPRLRSLSTLQPVPDGTAACFLQIYTGPLLRTHPLTVQSMRANNPAFHWITVHVGDLGEALDQESDTNWAPNYQLAQATPAEVEAWILRELGIRVSVSLASTLEEPILS